jgi:hypothetical protein
MLQSIPDPFDAYGPPPAEDQIFSILPPLSIMNMPSPSPSPLRSTPERDPDPGFTSAAAGVLWPPTNGGGFPESSSQWADVHSPSSTPPRSVSPPSFRRRPSMPPSSSSGPAPRKPESKLRSVLSIIDESHSRLPSGEDPSLPDTSPPPALNGDSSSGPETWEELPHSRTDDATPRSSTLFASQSGQPPDPNIDPNQNPSLEETPTSLTT